MRSLLVILTTLMLCLSLAIGACGPAKPAPTPAPKPAPAPEPVSAADFYKDKNVELIVTYAAGGGTDYGARLVASYWPEATGGGGMIVKNVAGGGGIVGANMVYNAKPDGLTMGATYLGTTVLAPVLLGGEGIEFKAEKFNWIGAFGGDEYPFSVGTGSPYESIQDLQKAKGLVLGGQGPRDNQMLGCALFIEVFNLDAKVISGYQGAAEQGLAAGRGEICGYIITAPTVAEQIGKKLLKKPLVVVGSRRTGFFPDTPAITEVAQLSLEQKNMLDLFYAISGWNMLVFFAPPGIPTERVEFARDAFAKTLANKAFIQQVKMRWTVWPEPVSGKDLAALVNKGLSIPKEDIAKADALMQKYRK